MNTRTNEKGRHTATFLRLRKQDSITDFAVQSHMVAIKF